MTMTLEQQRAADVWQRTEACNDQYTKLAKGLPALIMNSGLIQVLAFLHEKGGKNGFEHHKTLGDHLRNWLAGQFPTALPSAEFAPFMEALMHADPQRFQHITAEAMAWLRWTRQIAPARQTINTSSGH